MPDRSWFIGTGFMAHPGSRLMANGAGQDPGLGRAGPRPGRGPGGMAQALGPGHPVLAMSLDP